MAGVRPEIRSLSSWPDPQAMADAMLAFSRMSKAELAAMGERGRRHYFQTMSLEIATVMPPPRTAPDTTEIEGLPRVNCVS